MTWWCAATSLPWSWAWRAYPGVWLFVVLLGLAYWRWGRVVEAPIADRRRAARWYAAGVATVWVALDWPLGTLGGGYLASAHALQYVLLALAAPPLLLLGLGPRLAATADAHPAAAAFLRRVAHPLTGLLVYNLILFLTHFPQVVDRLMETQLGSFVVDMAWLAGGCFLWWPVTAPSGLVRLGAPLRMAYLFGQTILATLPAAFLTFADYPLYRLYEFAPRTYALLTPIHDHQTAGLLMKIVGDGVLWIGIAILFFRWANAERHADLEASRLPQAASRM